MSDALPEMQYRHLGRTGLKVSVISLGSWLTYGGHVGNGGLILIQVGGASLLIEIFRYCV